MGEIKNISEALAKREGWISGEGPAVPIQCESVIEFQIDDATAALLDPDSLRGLEFITPRPKPTLVEDAK